MQTATIHVEPLAPEKVLDVLRTRRGAANGITARDLAYLLTQRVSDSDQRKLRSAIEHLRLQGHPICAHPSLGYYLAVNSGDLDGTCEFLWDRARKSLLQITRMKNIAMPELRGQLGLPLQPTAEESEP